MPYTSYFIEPYLDWFLNSTDAPTIFGEASALMCLSTAALGKRWVTGADRLQPNLYMVIVGPSSRARKSTTIKRAKEIIDDVIPGRSGPTDYTMEGLYRWMQEKDEITGKGRTRLTLFANELAADLSRAGAYNAGFKVELNNLYDGGDIDKQRAGFGKSIQILAPRVSLFGAMTYENLKEHTSMEEWHNGFWMRFLYVVPTAWRELRVIPAAADPLRKQAAVNCFQQLWNALDTTQPMGLNFTDEATEIYSTMYMAHLNKMKEEKRTDDDHESPQEIYMQRFWPNVRKIALLYQLDMDPFQDVGADAMNRALNFAATCWYGYKRAYRETTIDHFGTLACEVEELIEDAGPGGCPISKLPSRYGHSKLLSEVLRYLEQINIVQRRVDAMQTVWFSKRK